MRVNVYREELGPEAKVVTKQADTGRTYHGARLYLVSPAALHDSKDDDDRSAVTLWFGDHDTCVELVRTFNQALGHGRED